MDPDEVVAEQLRLVRRLMDGRAADVMDLLADAARLAELVHALDGWLCAGGCLPRRWDVPR